MRKEKMVELKKCKKKLSHEDIARMDSEILKTFKGWWRFRVRGQCPDCKQELLPMGFPKFLEGQRYKCSDRNCAWGWYG